MTSDRRNHMGLGNRTPATLEEYNDYKTRFNNWGRWGENDQLGTLNHINTASTKYAISLVADGTTISCANPLATDSVVPDAGRNGKPADHKMSITKTNSSDYIGVSYHGFVNTHIDALCHFFTKSSDENGKLYNNRSPELVTENGALTNSIENWKNGIITRGVLYDIPKMRGTDYVEFDDPIHGWDLEDWAKSVNISPRDGDAVLIRSGHDVYWASNGPSKEGYPPKTPGNSPTIIEYLYDTNASLLGWDLQESEFKPFPYPSRTPIHEVIIPHMGMPILDNANFEQLSEHCAKIGRYEFLLIIAPLIVIGGTGSPVNPLATF